MELKVINTSDRITPKVDEYLEFAASLLVGDSVKTTFSPDIYRLTVRHALLQDGFAPDFIDTLLPLKDSIVAEDRVRVDTRQDGTFIYHTKYGFITLPVTVENPKKTLRVKLQRAIDLLKAKLQDNFFKPRIQISAQDSTDLSYIEQQHLAIRLKSKKTR